MAMRKKTVLFVTGTRAEWGLLASTIADLKKSSKLDLKVLVTGMHTQKRYGKTIREVKKAVKVDHIVPVKNNDDQLTALSKEINGINTYLLKHHIDAVMVLGDRDEPFAAATVALHMGIPVIHISGGDVSGPTVDHYLRNSIPLISDLHLVQTKESKKNVLKLGADPKAVHIVGSAGLNNLQAIDLPSRAQLAKKYHLDSDKKWYLASLHPTILEKTPIAKQIQSLLTALNKLDKWDEKIVLYPNADEGSAAFITAIKTLKKSSRFHIRKHITRDDYLALMRESKVLIGNTSSGLVEAGYLKVPFVNVGNRQLDRECGSNVLHAQYKATDITKCIIKAQTTAFAKMLSKKKSVYIGGEVSKNIVKHIEQFLKNVS